MARALPNPRQTLSPYAPRIVTIQVPPEKVKEIIGKGGFNIRAIQAATNTSIDIEDDGTVKISANTAASADQVIARINDLLVEVEVGRVYEGKVVRITDFGAFVNILPGRDGLVHISQIVDERVDNVNDYLRVGYALENTTDRLSTSLNYNTGIVFKAQFHPQRVVGYNDGQTFFTYNGTIYPTLTNMMGQLNNKEDFSTYADDAIKALAGWDGLKNFAASFVNDPTGYDDYLTDYAGEHLNEQFDADAEVLTWTYYMNNILGVVEDAQNGPQINQNGAETRAKLYESSEELLRTYYNGQCYYIWWLRHSNDGDDETNGVMEYAVVRNNIYKVNVESIYSLGGDIPDNEQLKAMVYVNKWTMLNPEVLPM